MDKQVFIIKQIMITLGLIYPKNDVTEDTLLHGLIDDIDRMEIAMEIEKFNGSILGTIKDEEISSWRNIGDIIKSYRKLITNT